jgi:hypothetical protein
LPRKYKNRDKRDSRDKRDKRDKRDDLPHPAYRYVINQKGKNGDWLKSILEL